MVDHLLRVHEQLQLLPDTLFLAINLFDRYSSKVIIAETGFELTGMTTLLVATKYLDYKCSIPLRSRFFGSCHASYSKHMLNQMELHILQTLDWIVCRPVLPAFLTLAMADMKFDPLLGDVVRYISEMTLYHKDFITVGSSMLAKASIHLARHILGRADTDQSPHVVAVYHDVIYDMVKCLSCPPPALFAKYSQRRYSFASIQVEGFISYCHNSTATNIVARPSH